MQWRFSDKVVVITGATGGIGSVTAAQFYKEGAYLTLMSREMADLEALAVKLNLSEERCLLCAADNTDEDAIRTAIRATVEKFGRIDIMVNNSGMIGAAGMLAEFPSESMKQVLDVNVMGTFYGMKYALQYMVKQRSGVIVNLSSISGVRGMPNTAAYVASKHAILGITKSTAVEYAQSGIRVCAVCPAPVETPMMKAVEDGMVEIGLKSREEIRKELVGPVPMGRYAKPEEIASAILYLASDDASFISGTALMVDGGFTA